MDFELRAAKEKWEREQREKKERARARLERERKAKDEAARLREALETSQRVRRIEAAEASLAAQQQEEEDVQLGDGIRFNRLLKVIPISGDGDKIRLPGSAFDALTSQNALDKGPMFFEVSAIPHHAPDGKTTSSNHVTHAGVLEFTAMEGFVELPPHVLINHGLSKGVVSGNIQARIRYVRLPKGLYVKFQAEDLDFCELINQKAVLETTLRQHATLSQGDLLVVSHGGQEYRLHVLEVKPASSVSVLETDIEVDVVGPSGDGTRSTGRLPLNIGKPEGGIVEEGKYVYFKFNIDGQLSKAAGAGEVDILIHLTSEDDGADADLYVSDHSILFPTQHQHHWASHNKGKKIVSLTGPGKNVEAGTYSIGVHGFKGLTKFAVLVEVTAHVEQRSQGQKLGSARSVQERGQQVQTDVAVCANCKQLVPSRTLSLHEAYCIRHNTVCSHPDCGIVLRKEEMNNHVHCERCGQAFGREELEKHMVVSHRPLQCACGAELPMEEMVTHRATVCPLRKITCKFCGDEVQAGGASENLRDRLRGLTQHESSCGSRTDACNLCGRSVMLKEMELHRAAAHGPASNPMKEMKASNPNPNLAMKEVPELNHSSAVISDGKTLMCPICSREFGGVNSEQEVSFHMDHDHFLSMEIEDVQKSDSTPAIRSDTFRQTLSVSCPICGMAVHSERDLNSHIDLVH
ncbi:hypothetical protein O6H91_19G080700 [Diphasiastrum complanatum]|uniref:Uncharacterized protein n=1 Tax=Diphasiastrum complanatum TaxID=34168 RepID=A0ACC2AWY2_DIPCM|nr:hypothetical protein O6H91_19G080700 [Diphasiastrum complanatum]